MIFGAIDEKSESHCPTLKRIFESIDNKQREYNWLITDCLCFPSDPQVDAMFAQEYCWISGEDLTHLIDAENFSWIWAVLCAFDKSIELSEVLKYPLPYADGYKGFWEKPLTMQHPLAKIEIVPWDGVLTLIFSEDKSIVDGFKQSFPESENLEDYIDN